jgi:hypothetical protein
MTAIQVQTTAFSVTITATTHIDAEPQRVWEVLTDTAAYPDWNPFVRRFEGDLVQGQRITVDLQPDPVKKPQTMRPRLVHVEAGRGFTWLGKVGVRGVLDGRHSFTVQASGNRSVLVQHEVLSGLLTPLFRRMLTVATPAAFAASNEALAVRARS